MVDKRQEDLPSAMQANDQLHKDQLVEDEEQCILTKSTFREYQDPEVNQKLVSICFLSDKVKAQLNRGPILRREFLKEVEAVEDAA